MDFLSNETIFYGGIVITAIYILSAVIYFSVSKIKSIKLNAKLDAEYGERRKK